MALITTAPLPRPVHLLNLLRRCPDDDEALTKPWLRDGDAAIWFSRAAWALHAALQWWGENHDGASPTLWLPNYFCNQSLWPARQTAAHLKFYPVRADLMPDWRACEFMAAANRPDLFVQVHYFGYSFDLSQARQFCDRHGALLIEDAAHVMVPNDDIGRWGDLVLYSPYKHLAVPDAGLLVLRPTLAQAVQAIASARLDAAPSASGWLVRRFLQSLAAIATDRPIRRLRSGFDDDPPTQALPAKPSLSEVSRKLLAAVIPDLAMIVRRKRLNDRALRRALSAAVELTPLFPEPGDGIVPYRTVFRADSPAAAVRWFDAVLGSRGLIETWPDLPPEISATPELHTSAHALRRTLLLLPNHASTMPQALERIYRTTVAATVSTNPASRSRASR